MKKIALFLNTYAPCAVGGMEVHARAFVNHFRSNGLLRFIICLDGFRCLDVVRGVTVSFASAREVGEFLDRQKVDVLFFNSGHWIEALPGLRRNLPQAKFFMRSGGNEIIKAPLSNMKTALCERQRFWAQLLNDNLDFLIVNSSYSVDRVCGIGVDRASVVLARGGVDLPVCCRNRRYHHANRNAFDRRYGTEGRTLFGIVSRFEPFKGIGGVLQVLNRHKELNWHLVLAGEGSDQSAILGYLQENFSSDRYTFLGSLTHPEAMKIISVMDWIVNCSIEHNRASGDETYVHTETMGRTMVEAFCQGTPIVATKVGGVRELFYECDFPGRMVNGIHGFEALLPELVATRYRISDAGVSSAYSWHSIFDGLYVPLMNMPPAVASLKALVVDIEGTLTHDVIDDAENERNLARVLELRRKCALVVNTAGEYGELVRDHPSIARCADEISIIANCGKKVFVNGRRCEFLFRLAELLPGPSDSLLREIESGLATYGCSCRQRRVVDRLYVNYKVEGDAERFASGFNEAHRDLAFILCSNRHNLKLISKEVNKGRALCFVLRHFLRAKYVVGAGNNVLDELFLKECDRCYMVNSEHDLPGGIRVRIESQADMEAFVRRLEEDVGA